MLMDNAVALVQAYLRVNGYFTVTEYPVVEVTRGRTYRAATDLDLLAFRFPHAGRLVPARGRRARADEAWHAVIDPALDVPPGLGDMLVGEVKEGRGVLNAPTTDPAVLRAALVRFGCCSRAEAAMLVEALRRDGQTMLPVGHRIRIAVFASATEGMMGGKYLAISLGHIIEFLQRFLREHWEVLRHAEHKDPAFGFLALLEKALPRTTVEAEDRTIPTATTGTEPRAAR
jgi:hypothetical protein